MYQRQASIIKSSGKRICIYMYILRRKSRPEHNFLLIIINWNTFNSMGILLFELRMSNILKKVLQWICIKETGRNMINKNYKTYNYIGTILSFANFCQIKLYLYPVDFIGLSQAMKSEWSEMYEGLLELGYILSTMQEIYKH